MFIHAIKNNIKNNVKCNIKNNIKYNINRHLTRSQRRINRCTNDPNNNSNNDPNNDLFHAACSAVVGTGYLFCRNDDANTTCGYEINKMYNFLITTSYLGTSYFLYRYFKVK